MFVGKMSAILFGPQCPAFRRQDDEKGFLWHTYLFETDWDIVETPMINTVANMRVYT